MIEIHPDSVWVKACDPVKNLVLVPVQSSYNLINRGRGEQMQKILPY